MLVLDYSMENLSKALSPDFVVLLAFCVIFKPIRSSIKHRIKYDKI